MKIIKNITAIVTLLGVLTMNAQITAGNSRTINSQDLLMSYDDGKLDGSPYLDADLKYGTVTFKDGTTSRYFMRYNALNDQIEFSEINDESKLKAMPNDPSNIYNIEDRSFQYISLPNENNSLTGIYEIIKIYDENNILTRRYKKSIIEPDEKAKSSYSTKSNSRIVDSEEFYLIEDDKVTEIDNHKRKSLRSLDPSMEKELKEFIKEKDIDFDDDGKGLAELIRYYRSIR